jgi:hypothetical protein
VAARRLVAILILMLVLSTIAAVLLPAPRDPIGGTTATTTSTTAGARAEQGRLVRAEFFARRHGQVARLRVGDELLLRVRGHHADQVELRGLGLVEPIGRDLPADFDVFAERPGGYDVVLVDAGERVGTIRITKHSHATGQS